MKLSHLLYHLTTLPDIGIRAELRTLSPGRRAALSAECNRVLNHSHEPGQVTAAAIVTNHLQTYRKDRPA